MNKKPTNESFSGKWPNDKKFAVFLSHDVDRIRKRLFHVIYYFYKEKRIYHLYSKFMKKEPYWNFDIIMELENKYRVKSTFFFLNESMKFNLFKPKDWKLVFGRYKIDDPKVVSKIRELSDGGWEAGVHGSYNSYQNVELLKKEKSKLEAIVGKKVYGIRQHYLNLEIPETWKKQREAGFVYDASFGLKNEVGFKDNLYYPFFPFEDSFSVFPLVIMDTYLMKNSLDVNDAWEKCIQKIDLVEKKNGILSVSWHQRVFNEKEFPGYTHMYEKIIKECKKRNAWFGTGKEIYEWVNESKRN